VSGFDGVRLRLDRVRAVVGEIDPVFLDTPALSCAPPSRTLGCSVTLKVETLNPVRSFKGRGAETVTAVAREQGGITGGVRERQQSRGGACLQRPAARLGGHGRGG
jgi:threonine dehydratase